MTNSSPDEICQRLEELATKARTWAEQDEKRRLLADEVSRRLIRLHRQFKRLADLNFSLMQTSSLQVIFDPVSETQITFVDGVETSRIQLKRANPDVPIALQSVSHTVAYPAGDSLQHQSELRRERMEEVEELLEGFYYNAHRVLKLLQTIPNLKNLRSTQVTIARNKLLEHADNTTIYSFGYGTSGPRIAPLAKAGAQWIDQGLFSSAFELVGTLHTMFGRLNCTHPQSRDDA